MTSSHVARLLLIGLLFVIILSSGSAYAKPTIKAYFNGQEATVEGVILKVNEPFDIDLNVTTEKDARVYILLKEPGGDHAYDRVGGEGKGNFVNKTTRAGQTVNFHWVLAANDQWTGGNAPVNIYYQIHEEPFDPKRYTCGYFTVVYAYISPERYAAPRKEASGPWALPIALLAAFLIARSRRKIS